MSRTRFMLALALALLLALGVPACGGDDDDEGAGGTGTQPAQTEEGGQAPGAAQTASEVLMSEFEFDPSNVTAAAGSTVIARNEGSVEHDLRLRQDGKEVGGTELVGPGGSEDLKLDFPAGRYEMFCSVPGHEDAGMVGSFTIE
jgi:uncharacterized cupredoxin-like copper-binding protein